MATMKEKLKEGLYSFEELDQLEKNANDRGNQ